MREVSMRTLLSVRRVLLLSCIGTVCLGMLSCAGGAVQQPIGVNNLPGVIQVSDWPYWLDIPVEETDIERLWRTVIDVVGERAAISVMDQTSGYLRTEFRQSPITYGGRASQERYTIRLRPREGRIRFGLEVRVPPKNTYPSSIINTVQAPWTAIYRELQQRLVTIR